MRASGYKHPPPRGDGVITALKVRKGAPDRLAVYLDGEFAFDLAAVVVELAGLRTGGSLSAEAQERLRDQDAPYRARSRSLRFLATRDRSEFETESRLRAAGFSAEVVEGTVNWLRGLGYLDDERFAASYASERLEAGWGERRVRAELRRRGVNRGVIEKALEIRREVARTAPGEADPLVASACRRFGAQFVSDPRAAERKLAGFLARRGHDWEEIGRVIREVASQVATDGDGAVSDRPEDPDAGGTP